MSYVLIISTTTTDERLLKTTKSKMNYDEEECLILEVQNKPPLWNYELPLKERNVKMKNQLWEEVAQVFNGKNKLIRTMWNQLPRN